MITDETSRLISEEGAKLETDVQEFNQAVESARRAHPAIL